MFHHHGRDCYHPPGENNHALVLFSRIFDSSCWLKANIVCACVCVFLLRVELMDYLDSIDCSLEDFQAMLYGKQFSMDFDPLEVKLSHIDTKPKTIHLRGALHQACLTSLCV